MEPLPQEVVDVGVLRRRTGLTVNGTRVFTSAVLREGDRLAVDLDAAERAAHVEPAPMALDVLFEDEHLLVQELEEKPGRARPPSP